MTQGAEDTLGAELKTGTVTPLPERLAVGRGTALFVDGRCTAPGGAITSLAVAVDDRSVPAIASGMPMPGSTAPAGPYWWAIVPFEPIDEARSVSLRVDAALAGGETASAGLGTLELTPELIRPGTADPVAPADAEGALVAVAMATYEPSRELFAAQVESIRAQRHRNWVCVISDDASSEEALTGMREVIGDDPRILLSPAERRAGVYGNFERALSLVPEAADYVTLCDQDDAWRPDKLEKLLAAFRPGVRLVYSDMRIVDRDGNVSSDTYWQFRRNNYTNFASLVLANTVTGAASMFDRALLDDVLPFPPRQGNAYHDHWVAQMALALGEIGYVDEPLYDYVQHGGAALGHLSANAFGRYGRSLATRVKMGLARVRQQGLSQGWRLYFDLYCRVRLAADVIEMRAGKRLQPDKRRALRRIADRPLGLAWLGARSLRSLRGDDETLGRERAMLAGLIWRRVVVTRRRWSRVRGSRPEVSAGTSEAPRLGAPGAGGSAGPWLKPLLVDYFTRDGSTLMMRLLGTSPQIAVEGIYPYEQKYFAYLWRWAQTLDRVRWPEEQWGPRSLGSLGQFRDAALVGPPPWHPRALIESQGDEPTMSERAFELTWAEFSARAARQTAERSGKPATEVRYAAEKHLNTWLVDRDALPPTELVVLLRDPRDTWVSINSFNEMRGSATLGRERADNATEHLEEIVSRQRERLRWIAALLEQGEVPVVRYEDLVLDLEGVARTLGEALGVELDPAAVQGDRDMRTRHVSSDSPEKSIGRWRTELDESTAELFAERLGSELDAVGIEV